MSLLAATRNAVLNAYGGAIGQPVEALTTPALLLDLPAARRNIARMYVPGIFFMETLFSPAGSGAEKGNTAGAKQYRNCQFFTPETKRSTHFFWDYLHDYDLHDPNIALSLNKSMIEGFLKNK